MGKAKQKSGRIETLSIKRIRRDFQSEDCLIDFKVDELAHALAQGEKFPPIRVFFDGKTYWLADGFHRIAAAERNGHRKIEAEVVEGTYADMEAEWTQGLEMIKQNLRQEFGSR